MIKKLCVLHTFNAYLHTTQNWAFRLIDNLEECNIVIASTNFLRCNFYPNKFTYIEFPLKVIDNPQKRLLIRVWNRFISYCYSLFLRKLCGKCHIMHSHFAQTGWLYLNLAKNLKIPHLVSFYGVDYEAIPYRNPVWKKRYARLLKKADMFLCEGPHGASVLKKVGCPSDKIRIARLGVDVSKIPFWNREKKPGELKLIQIAALTKKKGHKYTIEAFLRALQDCPNMTLSIVGPDRQGIKADLQNQIKGAAVGKIRFVEAIDFDGIYTFLKEYQVFIHPSCHTEEMDCEGGAPVVLLDAQATGMPIISTTHCDIPDEVVHGETGLLSPEKDTFSLSNSVRVFYNMGQKEYNLYSQNSRQHMESFFDAKQNARRILEIYKEFFTGSETSAMETPRHHPPPK